MTNFDAASLDRLCKRRAEKDLAHENSPDELKPANLAKKFGTTQIDVISRINAYKERIKKQ